MKTFDLLALLSLASTTALSAPKSVSSTADDVDSTDHNLDPSAHALGIAALQLETRYPFEPVDLSITRDFPGFGVAERDGGEALLRGMWRTMDAQRYDAGVHRSDASPIQGRNDGASWSSMVVAMAVLIFLF